MSVQNYLSNIFKRCAAESDTMVLRFIQQLSSIITAAYTVSIDDKTLPLVQLDMTNVEQELQQDQRTVIPIYVRYNGAGFTKVLNLLSYSKAESTVQDQDDYEYIGDIVIRNAWDAKIDLEVTGAKIHTIDPAYLDVYTAILRSIAKTIKIAYVQLKQNVTTIAEQHPEQITDYEKFVQTMDMQQTTTPISDYKTRKMDEMYSIDPDFLTFYNNLSTDVGAVLTPMLTDTSAAAFSDENKQKVNAAYKLLTEVFKSALEPVKADLINYWFLFKNAQKDNRYVQMYKTDNIFASLVKQVLKDFTVMQKMQDIAAIVKNKEAYTDLTIYQNVVTKDIAALVDIFINKFMELLKLNYDSNVVKKVYTQASLKKINAEDETEDEEKSKYWQSLLQKADEPVVGTPQEQQQQEAIAEIDIENIPAMADDDTTDYEKAQSEALSDTTEVQEPKFDEIKNILNDNNIFVLPDNSIISIDKAGKFNNITINDVANKIVATGIDIEDIEQNLDKLTTSADDMRQLSQDINTFSFDDKYKTDILDPDVFVTKQQQAVRTYALLQQFNDFVDDLYEDFKSSANIHTALKTIKAADTPESSNKFKGILYKSKPKKEITPKESDVPAYIPDVVTPTQKQITELRDIILKEFYKYADALPSDVSETLRDAIYHGQDKNTFDFQRFKLILIKEIIVAKALIDARSGAGFAQKLKAIDRIQTRDYLKYVNTHVGDLADEDALDKTYTAYLKHNRDLRKDATGIRDVLDAFIKDNNVTVDIDTADKNVQQFLASESVKSPRSLDTIALSKSNLSIRNKVYTRNDADAVMALFEEYAEKTYAKDAVSKIPSIKRTLKSLGAKKLYTIILKLVFSYAGGAAGIFGKSTGKGVLPVAEDVVIEDLSYKQIKHKIDDLYNAAVSYIQSQEE